MAGPEKLNGREHSDAPWCWCSPMVYQICEACDLEGEESPGVACPHCRGTNIFQLTGRALAEVREAFMDSRHPALVVIHMHLCDDCTGIHLAPRLIPGVDDGEEFDRNDDDSEPWAQNPDAWKNRKG